VERIVEGLTPTQHVRFVFQAPPSSLLQLEQLAVVDRNIAYADQTRTVQSTAVTVGVVESHPEHWNSRHSHAQSPPTSRPGKPCLFLLSEAGTHSEKALSLFGTTA